jgi:hypothetical protein
VDLPTGRQAMRRGMGGIADLSSMELRNNLDHANNVLVELR